MTAPIALTPQGRKKRAHTRICDNCKYGRIDGKSCGGARKCLCKCHREEYLSPAMRSGIDALVASGWKVPLSFEEEVAAGKFGPVGPRRVK